MTDYISREAAIADLELYETQVVRSEYALAIAGCRSHIRNLPAADVRPVVLCRDCKHRFNYPICVYHGDDWFCGYGEKREES